MIEKLPKEAHLDILAKIYMFGIMRRHLKANLENFNHNRYSNELKCSNIGGLWQKMHHLTYLML
jgi:hypothetical protein